MTDDLLLSFLSETLAMWGVAGTVEGGEAPVVALICAQNGTLVWIERGGAELPFRWFARWRAAGDAADGAHRRACASLVGLLSALRRALGVDRGSAVRVAPVPGA
ncbi:MAG TPA: hypothetical protein VM164_02370 [Burkholderiales bacterium]|nr:hypothetical protein [Burkholderiales bacterium]